MTAARPTNWRNLLTVLSVMLLVGTEVFGVALAAGWAIAGLFELGPMVGYVLMGLFSLIGIYALTKLWHQAIHVESVRGGA